MGAGKRGGLVSKDQRVGTRDGWASRDQRWMGEQGREIRVNNNIHLGKKQSGWQSAFWWI